MWPFCVAYWALKLAHIALWTSSLTKSEQQKWPYNCFAGSWSVNSIFQLKWLSIPWYFPTRHICCWWKNIKMAIQRQSAGPLMQGIVCGQQQTIKKKGKSIQNWIYIYIVSFLLFCRSKHQILVAKKLCTLISLCKFTKSHFWQNPFIHCHCKKRKKKFEMYLWLLCNYWRICLHGCRRLL